MDQNVQSPAHCLNSLAEGLTHCWDPPFLNKDLPEAACQQFAETRSFKGDTEENVNGFKDTTLVEADVQITRKESSEGWGDCSSDNEFLSSEDDHADTADLPEDCTLMVVESDENITALAGDRSTAEFDKEAANLLIEERIIDIARILGISVEDRLGELRSFISEMVKKDKGRGKDVTNSKKKSRAKRIR